MSSSEESPSYLELSECDVLHGSTSDYLVQCILGEGCFGQVVQCLKVDSQEIVAVKILKEKGDEAPEDENELAMLNMVKCLDPDTSNIVCFHESFLHLGHLCLVFEMLDKSLLHYMSQTNSKRFSVNEIRSITLQLLNTFKSLKTIKMIHSDLKLDNIMLVNHQNQPYRVKLIDFGLAIPALEVEYGDILQPIGCRAPEVVLGLQITEAIDMWGLGCALATMFLGRSLYPCWAEYEMIRAIVATRGMPTDDMLDDGLRTSLFFTRDLRDPTWRLKWPGEYFRQTGLQPRIRGKFETHSLDSLFDPISAAADEYEKRDAVVFVDLLKRLLCLDADKRITPSDALNHPFLTMSHLVDGYKDSSYFCHHADFEYRTTAGRGFAVVSYGARQYELWASLVSPIKSYYPTTYSDIETNLSSKNIESDNLDTNVKDSYKIMSVCPSMDLSFGTGRAETCSQQDQTPVTYLPDFNGGDRDREEDIERRYDEDSGIREADVEKEGYITGECDGEERRRSRGAKWSDKTGPTQNGCLKRKREDGSWTSKPAKRKCERANKSNRNEIEKRRHIEGDKGRGWVGRKHKLNEEDKRKRTRWQRR